MGAALATLFVNKLCVGLKITAVRTTLQDAASICAILFVLTLLAIAIGLKAIDVQHIHTASQN